MRPHVSGVEDLRKFKFSGRLARLDPHLRVVQPAVDAPLFERLRRAVRALGREGLRGTYQRTFWFDLTTPHALPEREARPGPRRG